MATHPDFPGASSFADRHGKTRWRYRAGGKTISLPGMPGETDFAEAYHAALTGEHPRSAQVVYMPGMCLPRSFGKAWQIFVKSAEWREFDPATQDKHRRMADAFLFDRVDGGEGEDPLLWRDVPVADMRRKHVKLIIARHAATPHKAKHILVTLRKLTMVALDEEWIETDPTWKVTHRPEYKGWRAWREVEMLAFEARHPLGTLPRAIYAAALWAGQRRSDVVTLRRSERQVRKVMMDGRMVSVDCFIRPDEKMDREAAIPVTPMLAKALDALPHLGDFYFPGPKGGHRSVKALTGDMAKWTEQAGLPNGCTIHGLRKTLGKMAAEGGATTRESKDLLNHSTLQQAELYSREAEQLRMSATASNKVVKLHLANRMANPKLAKGKALK